MPNELDHAGAFVMAARLRRNLSGRALAQRAKLSSGYISKLETGDIEPSVGHFARLVVALDLNPWEVWVALRVQALRDCQSPSSSSVEEEVA